MTTNNLRADYEDSLVGREKYERNEEVLGRYEVMIKHFEENPELIQKEGNRNQFNKLRNDPVFVQNQELKERLDNILERFGKRYTPLDFVDSAKKYGVREAFEFDKFLTETRLKHTSPRAYKTHSIGKALANDFKKMNKVAGSILYPLTYTVGVVASLVGEVPETIDSLESRLNLNKETEEK